MSVMLETRDLSKSFTLFLQGGVHLPVLSGIHLTLHGGECVALHGRSGAGKSTLMRTIYGNYRATSGQISILHRGAMVDLATATPRTVLDVRKHSLGYVSQFLRVVPRVPAIEIVAEVAAARGSPDPTWEARGLLRKFNLPDRLHGLPPATFSGGEQQRVNLARGFAGLQPILLLDEPTASLDQDNRNAVIRMIIEAKQRGTAILGIFHDAQVRQQVADRLFDIT